MTAKKRGSGIRRVARAIDAALKDADLARKHSSDPAFHKDVQADRRAALSKYRTVQHALADRERIERAKAEPKKKRSSR